MVNGNNLTILTSYYKPAPGGCCKRYFRAINALLDRGHVVHYLSVVKFPIDHPNCFHHRFPWSGTFTDNVIFWGAFYFASPFMFAFLVLRYNITHCFVFHPAYAFGLRPARLFKDMPVTVFYRADHILNHEIKGTRKWIIAVDKIVEKIALKNTKIFCVSHSLVEMLRTRISPGLWKSIEVIPNDVIRKKYDHVPADTFRLATVGILEERKNLILLLRLMEHLRNYKVRLDIYGTGPYEQRLKMLADESGLDELVKFHGWVDRDNIWPNVDLLLMPSLHEGAPNSVLEALGSDIPVLASDIPEHREILGEFQLLNPDEPQAWLSCIKNMLGDIERNLAEFIDSQSRYRDALIFNWDEKIVEYITEAP